MAKLAHNGKRFLERAKTAGLDVGTSEGLAVVPIIIGDSILAAVVSHRLAEAGVNVQPIIYPAVPEKAARLRFFITSNHSDSAIDTAVDATADVLKRTMSEGEGLKLLADSLSR